MRRVRWTFMQWSSEACKFVPKRPGDPLPPLISRQRITSIDKIEREPVDGRAPMFKKALESSIPSAQSLLEKWCDTLQVSALEQYASVLACKTGDVQKIPAAVRQKLARFGLLEILEAKIDVGLGSNVSKLGSTSPLEILARHPEVGSADLQKSIQSSTCFSTEIQELQERWSRELRLGTSSFHPGLEGFSSIHNYLLPEDLCQVVAREMALLTASSVIAPFPKSLTSVCRKLGSRIEEALLAAVGAAHESSVPGLHRRSEYLYSLIGQSRWTKKQRIIIGAYWAQLALKHCRFTQLHNSAELARPAFWKTWHMSGRSKRGVFIVNPFLIKKLQSSYDGKTESASFEPRFITAEQIPSLVPLPPWTSTDADNVDLCTRDLSLVTSASTEGHATVAEAIRTEAMLPQLQGLNRLQSQAWKINRQVLAVLKTLRPWEEQDSGTHIGVKTSKIVSDAPSRKASLRQWTHAITIAESLGAREFYLPMYMDFRGRCYPASRSILSFMGNDSMRALFQFGDSKPLGPDGLQWLEIHLANLYGQCKSQAYDDRRRWVADHRAEIISSAKTPINSSWWRRGQKQFQTLAACIELNNAWSCDNPSEYACPLPIQLDGTSNGLQHLVALARDEVNAPKVNLASGARCADIYTSARTIFPRMLDRSVVKKAIMTFFYGASVAQITRSLNTEDSSIDSFMGDAPEPDSELSQSSEWATRLTAMFAPERAVQQWLVDCTRRIMSARRADQSFSGSALAWTSPLGLPVVQPYVEPKLMAIRTSLQSFYVQSAFHLPAVTHKKQLSAVVANFVHSLDATHMLATARAMPKDCSFAAVHDSFWTHAGTVPILNRVLRKEFVRLHERHILDDLRDEWTLRYDSFMVLAHVHSDSPMYERLLWHRDGVCEGYKQRELLESELRDIYHQKDVIKPRPSDIKWVDNVPHIGTPGLPRIQMWVPLELDPPPSLGSFDVKNVLDAAYFFS